MARKSEKMVVGRRQSVFRCFDREHSPPLLPRVQFNDLTANKSTDQPSLRWLSVIRWGLLAIGCIACLIGAAFTQEDPKKFDTGLIAVFAGIIGILSFMAIGMIRKRVLKQFREIDELKSEIQKLKDILAQK